MNYDVYEYNKRENFTQYIATVRCSTMDEAQELYPGYYIRMEDAYVEID